MHGPEKNGVMNGYISQQGRSLIGAVAAHVIACVLFPAALSAEIGPQMRARINVPVLNVRSEASLHGSVIGTVKQNELVRILKRSENRTYVDNVSSYWYQIRFGDKEGWVFGAFLNLNVEKGYIWRNQYLPRSAGIVVTSEGSALISAGNEFIVTSGPGSNLTTIAPRALGNTIGRINKMIVSGPVIWLAAGGSMGGSTGGGIWKTTNNGRSWAQYTTAQGLASNDVNTLVLDKEMLWAGTVRGLSVSKDQGKTWKRYGPEDPALVVTALAVAGNRVFVGTPNGLYILDEKSGCLFGGEAKSWVRIGKGQPNLGEEILSLHLTPAGKLYVGTNAGLALIDVNKTEQWSAIGGETRVNAVIVDNANRILVATNNGLNISTDNGDSWSSHTRKSGLAGEAILDVGVSASSGIVWVVIRNHGFAYSE